MSRAILKSEMPTPESFSKWVYSKLGADSLTKLSIEGRLLYSGLHNTLNGRNGRMYMPERETALKIGLGLVALGKIGDPSEALIAAGYLPDGWTAMPPSKD